MLKDLLDKQNNESTEDKAAEVVKERESAWPVCVDTQSS
jgi:hypothetical protein